MGLTLVTASACGTLLHRETPAQDPAIVAPTTPVDAAPQAQAAPDAHHAHEPAHETVAPQAPRQPAPAEAMTQRANDWLALSREAQRQEYLRAESLYQQSGSLRDLVDLALLAALRNPERPETTRRIRSNLRAHVEQNAQAGGNDELTAIARPLLQILDERERLLGQLATQNETLQHQLNELKAIEEQLRDRSGSEPIQAPQ
jgi:hypothetical protein